MRREISLGGNQFQSGYHHVKVNVEKIVKVLCQLLSSGYVYVLGASIMALQQFLLAYLEHLIMIFVHSGKRRACSIKKQINS